MRARILLAFLIGGISFWLGRQSLPELRERLDPPTAHERYARRLEEAGLTDAALGRIWLRESQRALAAAPLVEAPFRETGYLDPGRPEAVAYRVRARDGQRLRFELRIQPPTNAMVFLDVFRIPPEAGRAPVRVASAERGERALEVEPRRDGEYVVRVQPELLRGGGYTLTLVVEPTLAFPVSGAGPRSVQSVFGDPRDGGRREHHGIDIFVPRGTPVVAAVEGRVTSVRTTEVGGRVVWLRDDRRGQSLYYAHLDEQLVDPLTRVSVGDTLGRVGNSGNARSTPPHLHFGIYRRGDGPVDPLPFVAPLPTSPPDPSLPPTQAGATRRVGGARAPLRSAPDGGAPVVGELDPETPVEVAGIAGEWLRVRLGDGRRGFVAASATGPAAPLRTIAVDADDTLRAGPHEQAARVALPDGVERVEVLGRLSGHLLVRSGGRTAWLPEQADRGSSLDRRGRNAGQ